MANEEAMRLCQEWEGTPNPNIQYHRAQVQHELGDKAEACRLARDADRDAVARRRAAIRDRPAPIQIGEIAVVAPLPGVASTLRLIGKKVIVPSKSLVIG